MLFFFFLVFYSKDIALTSPVYFFLVVIIGLISTGFLSGAMKSIAKYNVNYQNKSIYLAGPAVIFFIILYIGIKYKPETNSPPLTISILLKGDGDKELITEGFVSVRVGEYSASKQINTEGIASFTGIDPKYKGLKFDITSTVPGYVMRPLNNEFALSSTNNYTNITVYLNKKKHFISLRGRVIQLPERIGISNAYVEFQGLNETFKTDSLGNFSAVLPFQSGVSTRIVVLKGAREIYNSLRTVSDNDFLSIPATYN